MSHRHRIKFSLPGSSGMTYEYGKYSVTIDTNGAIRVKPGDWLSKYSAAIYGNFWTIDVFSRRHPSGRYVPIANPDSIYAGEIIYHMPTIWGRMDENMFSGATITAPPISDIDKKKRMVEHFKREHPEATEIAEKIALGLHTAAEVAEMMEALGILSEGVGDIASAAALPLFVTHATLDILNSYDIPLKAIGLRASAYGITAWAFGDPSPPVPQWLRSTGPGDMLVLPLSRYQGVWTEAAANAMSGLDAMVQNKKVKKEDCQFIFQDIGDDDRNTLAKEIMTEMQSKFDSYGLGPQEKLMFWQPPPQYPSR